MIAALWALLGTAAAVGLGDLVNRRVVGWLPDDPPRPGRKQHQRPMPLAGVLLLPTLLTLLLLDEALVPALAVAIQAAVGFVDDRRKERGDGLDWRWKALGLGVGCALLGASVVDPIARPAAALLAAAFAFVLTNAVNFLDNTDGVAAALTAAMLLCLGCDPALAAHHLAPVALGLGGAALGFLAWNWPTPRVFLGDAGAYALGATTSWVALSAARVDSGSMWSVAVPLADFAQVVTARVVLAVPPWVGDRRHLTHIAQNLGLPRRAVAPLFATLAVGVWAAARLR
ncbi:MAG: hypothetical protein H6835_06200 [Planctomycetes bacterium]|nr:hypothetical protein [Planctomycetota bacterium]